MAARPPRIGQKCQRTVNRPKAAWRWVLTAEYSRWRRDLRAGFRLTVWKVELKPMGLRHGFRPRVACRHESLPLRLLNPSRSHAIPLFLRKLLSHWNGHGLRPVAISVRRRHGLVADWAGSRC